MTKRLKWSNIRISSRSLKNGEIMNQTTKRIPWIMIMLFVFGVASLMMDIADIAAGRVDANRHIPFLYPVITGIFAWMVWYIDRFPETRKTGVVRTERRGQALNGRAGGSDRGTP